MQAGEAAFMKPIHAIQSLNDTYTVALGGKNLTKCFGGADDQNDFRVRAIWVMMSRNTKHTQSADEFGLE